jgi:hypothetical protein
MSCFVLIENGFVTGRRGGPYDGHIEAPDHINIGWKLENGEWSDPQAESKTQAENYAAALTGGYLDETLGVRLKTTQKAQRDFVAMAMLIREGLELGLISNDTMQTIWNFDNEPVELTVLQIRQLFDDYAP